MNERKLPALQNRACLFTDYDAGWIAELLQRAADRAGVRLPLKEEMARAVILYLETRCPLRVLPLDFLIGRIRRMLRQVGLPRVADAVEKETPPVEIALPELARDCPLPLFFYSALRRRLETLHQAGLMNCTFSGKRECVLALRNGKRWSSASQAMMADLENFLDDCIPARAHRTRKKREARPAR